MCGDVGCTAVASSMARIGSAAEAAGLVAVAELALRRRAGGARRGLSDEECDEHTADEVGALLQMSRLAARSRLVLRADADAARRWVTDGDGAVVSRSTRSYRPGAAMVQLLRARDGTCRFPTCRRRASACDIDHVVPWPAGPTDVDNHDVMAEARGGRGQAVADPSLDPPPS